MRAVAAVPVLVVAALTACSSPSSGGPPAAITSSTSSTTPSTTTASSSPSSTTVAPAAPTPTPTTATFEDTYAEVSSGVVRIDVQGCAGSGSGTGFIVGDGLVATVAHVVSDAATVRVTQGTRSASAVVLGLDDGNDTALIRTGSLTGHVFAFSEDGPDVGQRIGVIGFPVGDSGLIDSRAGSKSFKEGSVNGLDRKQEVGGRVQGSLVELDALARSGNSGSPVIDVEGQVVGLLSAGPADADAARARFAVDSRVAQPLIDEWAAADTELAPSDCSSAVGPDGEALGFDDLPGGESAEVAATLNLYFASINQSDYETAYAQLHPDLQAVDGVEAFGEGLESSVDSEIEYWSMARSGRDLLVWVTFRSTQDATQGPEGLECTRWSLDYTLRQSEGLWLIAGTDPHGDLAEGYERCPEVDG